MATCIKVGGVTSNPSIQEWLVNDTTDRDSLIGKVGAGTQAHLAGYTKVWEMSPDLEHWIEIVVPFDLGNLTNESGITIDWGEI